MTRPMQNKTDRTGDGSRARLLVFSSSRNGIDSSVQRALKVLVTVSLKFILLSVVGLTFSNVVAMGADSASYVGQTIADGTAEPAGQNFTKTWTIKNSGTTTWNSGYSLQYVSGSVCAHTTQRVGRP